MDSVYMYASFLPVFLAVGSWFISPVLAGTVSILLFYMIKYFILNKVSTAKSAKQLAYAVNVVHIFGPVQKKQNKNHVESNV